MAFAVSMLDPPPIEIRPSHSSRLKISAPASVSDRSGFGWNAENTGLASSDGFRFISVPVSGSMPTMSGLRRPSFSMSAGSLFRLSRPLTTC